MLNRVEFLKANTLLAELPAEVASDLAERMLEVRASAGDAGTPGAALDKLAKRMRKLEG